MKKISIKNVIVNKELNTNTTIKLRSIFYVTNNTSADGRNRCTLALPKVRNYSHDIKYINLSYKNKINNINWWRRGFYKLNT